MKSMWNLFRNQHNETTLEKEIKPAPIFNDNDIVTVLNPNLYAKFSELGQKICKAISDDAFYKIVDSNRESYARKLAGIRFTRHSNHPSSVHLSENSGIAFKEADYILDVSYEGKVNYQIIINGRHYPIAFHEMDPDIKFFHNENIEPLLEEQRKNEELISKENEELVVVTRSAMRR